MNWDIFEEIFEAVMNELAICNWWELFDSGDFEVVEERICDRFGVTDPTEVEGFIEWNNEMCDEL